VGKPRKQVGLFRAANTRRTQEQKIADYLRFGVQKRWVVSPDTQEIKILGRAAVGPISVAVYGLGQSAQWQIFPGRTVPVSALCAP
jgi:Uma2 family endonuclease